MFTVTLIQPANDTAMAQIIRQVMTEHGLTEHGFALHDPEVDSLSATYATERSRYWVVKKGEIVLGGAGIAPLKEGPPSVCELQKMYFLSEARGSGMGEKLLHLCLQEAKQLGFTHCYLETAPQLKRAKALYERTGFSPLTGPMGNTGHYRCSQWYLKDLSIDSSPP